MTKEEARKIVEEHGYEIEEDLGDGSFWVYTDEGLRLLYAKSLVTPAPRQFGKAPAIRFENRFPSGTFKYMTHGMDDKRDVPCIEDYACAVGRESWPDYVQIKDKAGNVVREGPKPFRNAEERRSYERLTRIRQHDKGE